MAALTSSGWPGSATVSAYPMGSTVAAKTATASAAGVASFTGLTPAAPYTLSDGTTSRNAYADPVPAGADTVNTVTLGATYTIPSGYGQHNLTLGANTTITAPAPAEGAKFVVVFRQDATGSRTVAWAAAPNIDWPGGSAPTIIATASSTDIVNFRSDDGIRWLAYRAATAVA